MQCGLRASVRPHNVFHWWKFDGNFSDESRDSLKSVDQSREPFSTCALFRTVVLALGFSVAVILRCYSCFHQQLAFHVMNITVVVNVIVQLLVGYGAGMPSLNLDRITATLLIPRTSFLTHCKRNKGTVLFVALFLMCTGLFVTQLFSTQAFQMFPYFLIMNAVVGIALPVALGDFIVLNIELEDEMKSVVFI